MCWQELININQRHFDDSETKSNHSGYTLGGVVNLKLFGAILDDKKIHIWVDGADIAAQAI